MSSNFGVLQRSLGQLRAAKPWRPAPSSSSSSSSSNRGASQLFPRRLYRLYNSSAPTDDVDEAPTFQLKKHLVGPRSEGPASKIQPFTSGPRQPISLMEFGQENGGEETFGQDPIQFGPTRLMVRVKGRLRLIEYSHLRDLCTCPTCVDQSTKQRNFQTSQIPLNIQPKSYGVEDGKLVVKWLNDIPGVESDHTSTYSEQEINDVYQARSNVPRDKHRILWDRELIEGNVRRFDWEDYLNNEEEFTRCMRDLSRFGLVILKGVPDSREMVKQVATRMGPIRNSFYGETWDVRSVQQPKNVAYTDQFLNFHMDLLYMKEPPGYQLLHCLRNSCTGGESLFSDAFRTARYMFREEPVNFQTLTSFNVNYGYKNMDQDFHKSWPTIERRPDATEDDGFMNIDHINYSPPFQAPFRNPWDQEFNNKYRQYIWAAKSFAKQLEDPENVYQFKLDPGDCVIFENRRVVHARKAFDTSSGERWLAGAYVDEDAVRSRFRVLIDKYPEIWREHPLTLPSPYDRHQELPTWLKPLVRNQGDRKLRYVFRDGKLPRGS